MNIKIFFKKHILCILSILCTTQASLYAQKNQADSKIEKQIQADFNWGVKIGMNAPSINHYDVELNGVELEEKIEYTNKVGYTLATFARINMDRIFMQPEISWSGYQREMSLGIPTSTNNFTEIKLKSKSKIAEVDVLVGYYIIKERPFSLSVMLGPSFKYIYKTNYETNLNADFSDKNSSYILNGVGGFSLCIEKVYFDVRYEINIQNPDIDFNEISNAPEALNNILIKKRENILNFSCGLIF